MSHRQEQHPLDVFGCLGDVPGITSQPHFTPMSIPRPRPAGLETTNPYGPPRPVAPIPRPAGLETTNPYGPPRPVAPRAHECEAQFVWNAALQKCVCAPGTVWSDVHLGCVTQTCPRNQRLLTEVINGQTQTRCIYKCPAGEKYNPENDGCVKWPWTGTTISTGGSPCYVCIDTAQAGGGGCASRLAKSLGMSLNTFQGLAGCKGMEAYITGENPPHL